MLYSFDLDFTLDGQSAKTNGIIMQHEPTFSALESNIETFEIPGRTGALHCFDGTYKDRTVSIECYCLRYDDNRDTEEYTGSGVYSVLRNAEMFLFPPNDSQNPVVPCRKLAFKPWLSGVYYNAIILNGMEVQAKLCTLAPFTIEFLISPFPISEGG